MSLNRLKENSESFTQQYQEVFVNAESALVDDVVDNLKNLGIKADIDSLVQGDKPTVAYQSGQSVDVDADETKFTK